MKLKWLILLTSAISLRELNIDTDKNMVCDTDAETALSLFKNTKNTQKFWERRIPHPGKKFLSLLSQKKKKKIR